LDPDADASEFFRAGCSSIVELMPRLMRALNDEDRASSFDRPNATLTKNLSAVSFLANRKGDVVATLWNATEASGEGNRETLEARALDETAWNEAANRVLTKLNLAGIVARRRRKTLVASKGSDRVWETVEVFSPEETSRKETLTVSMVEGAFSNPNADVAEITAGWLRETVGKAKALREDRSKETARDGSQGKKVSLVELFSGNGTHAVNLARFFDAVTCVEIDPRLCDAARENFKKNQIENATARATPAEKFAAAAGKKNECETFDDFVLVDPPRAGLDPVTLSLVRTYRTILYIACDSRSLVRDMRERGLEKTHVIRRAAVFDHFPYSKFCEVAVWAERRDDAR
jgi:tRNA (uracil-5-)-methyltransferase